MIYIVHPLSLIAVAIAFVLYAMATAFYLASAREINVRASQTRIFEIFSQETLPAA